MNPEEYSRVRELYGELHDLSEDECRRVLAEREDIPSAVRRKVERILAYHEHDATRASDRVGAVMRGVVEAGAPDSKREEESSEILPRTLGTYELHRKLGEGGMGIVYAARREESTTEIALKVIRPGMGSAQFYKRFRRESEMLRKLHHPGIAAFHDAGEVHLDEHGVDTTYPFLAMELIDGVSLTSWADAQDLDDHQRIELIARVCDALQHAHETGVVHRDLKPGNILVIAKKNDDIGQPKVLDFGVALALDATGLHTMTATASGAVIGTVPYMSPEQVAGAGSDSDPRSDVYSLGVLLFEMLTGRLPYDVRGRPLHVAARIILEQDPTRLGSVVARLRGDLEIILAKVLEKDANHRYLSSADFADDLRRFVSGQPISARPPSVSEQVRRFSRRNKTLVVSVLVLIGALSVGLIGMAWLWLEEAESRRISDGNAYRAQIAIAAGAVSRHDVATAKTYLEATKEPYRGWEWQHLMSRLDDSIQVLDASARPKGDKDAPRRFIYDPADSLLRCVELATESVIVQTYDLKSGAAIDAPRVLAPFRWSAVGGEHIYLCEDDVRVLVKNIADGATLATRALPPGTEWQVAGGENLTTVLLTSGTGRALLMDATSNRPPIELTPGPTRRHSGTAIDPTGRFGAVASREKVHIWRLQGRRQSWALDPPNAEAKRLRFSPSGSHLATIEEYGSRVGVFRLAMDRPPVATPVIAIPTGRVLDCAFSPDGQALAIVDGTLIRTFSVPTGKPETVRAGHAAVVRSVGFSKDGTRLISLSDDDTIRIWSAGLDPRILAHPRYVYSVCFDEDGHLFTGSWDGSTRVFDAASSTETARFEVGPDLTERAIAVNPKKQLLAVSSIILGANRRDPLTGSNGLSSARIRIFDLVTGREVVQLPREGPLDVQNGDELRIDFSPDGQRLVGQSARAGITIWDTADWRVVASTQFEPYEGLAEIRYSPDGRYIAAAGPGMEVLLLESESLRRVASLTGHKRAITALAFRPGGLELASADLDGMIFVWDVDRREKTHELRESAAPVFCLAWSPNGSRFVSGGLDPVLRVWDANDKVVIARLPGHTDYIKSVAFSPDGRRIVTGSGDGTARIWDFDTLAVRVRAAAEFRAIADRIGSVLETFVVDGDIAAAQGRVASKVEWSARERQIAHQLLLRRVRPPKEK